MDEYELLLRHASNWAGDRKRTLDAGLVSLALQMRADHDDLKATDWPARSAEHLMLVRWPAHGPIEPPDVDLLVDSLDTFWGFLRSTGRMTAASAQPAQLRREAKRAAPRMAAACADETNFGTAKQLLGFGSEIGIDLDDVPNVEEANRRLQQIVEAWNAQPEEVRLAKSHDWPRPGGSIEDEDEDESEDLILDPAVLPESPLFQFDREGHLIMPPALDLDASAAQARSSGVVQRMLALAEWVGDGKPITATDTLRPAVARVAYTELGLDEWERERLSRRAAGAPDWLPAPPVEPALAWRSATECFALERLWRPALSAGVITTSGRTARFNPSAVPTTSEGWLRLALMLAVPMIASWNDGANAELAIDALTLIDAEYGQPALVEEIAENWWDSPANTWRGIWESVDEDEDEPSSAFTKDRIRDISNADVHDWLAVFADHNLWREQHGRLIGTEFGRDVLIVVVALLSENNPWE